MGLFFNKSKSVKPGAMALQAIDHTSACAVLQHFPIGTTVHYYPEFRKNITLESVIIGYKVNSAAVFSAQDLVCEKVAETGPMLRNNEGKPIRLNTLGIIIPAESRGIGQLDYARREELERSGGFTVGNNITLMGPAIQGKVPLVQSTVSKNLRVEDGPFAKIPLVVLETDVASLQLTEQRAHMRVKVQLPAQIIAGTEGGLDCTLADLCERSMRLRAGEGGWPTDIVAGRRLSVAFRLPGCDKPTQLQGEIYRVDYNDLVIKLEDIQRDGRFQRIEVIDMLGIKSKLLQLPDASA